MLSLSFSLNHGLEMLHSKMHDSVDEGLPVAGNWFQRLLQPLRLTALVLVFPFLTGAEVYRWVDSHGVVNYTQNAPAGIESEKIRTQAGGPSVVVQQPIQSNEPSQPELSPEQQAMLDKLKVAEDARQAEINRIREANCERSKSVLSRLSERGRIRTRDSNGEQTIMDETERQRRIEEAQKGIVANCDQSS